MEIGKGYCVDSDVLIDYLRGIENARRFLTTESEKTTLYISVASIVELYAGKDTRSEEKRKRLEEFLENFVIIELDREIGAYAGILRRDYGGLFADMIIAATALTHNLRLMTRNVKHFIALTKKENLEVVKPY